MAVAQGDNAAEEDTSAEGGPAMVRSYGCSRCGAGHDSDAWNALALSHRIEPVEVRRLVSDWPDDRTLHRGARLWFVREPDCGQVPLGWARPPRIVRRRKGG